MKLSLQQYLQYFAVGSVVGISAVALREALDLVVKDAAAFYLATVLVAYGYGIAASYHLHKNFTFRGQLQSTNRQLHLSTFTIVAITGMFLTGGLALLFRYGFDLDTMLPRYAGAVAFILAAISTSLCTYYLNARYSVRAPTEGAQRRGS